MNNDGIQPKRYLSNAGVDVSRISGQHLLHVENDQVKAVRDEEQVVDHTKYGLSAEVVYGQHQLRVQRDRLVETLHDEVLIVVDLHFIRSRN
jgi:hypothetical protein